MWHRSHLLGLAKGDPVAGRLGAKLPLSLSDMDTAAVKGGATPFDLYGVGDVAGLEPTAITARYPQPGAGEAEFTKSAHIEFRAADLPWRYAPGLNGQQLRPWLVLVVGTPDEVIVGRRGRVTVRGAALSTHNLSVSYQWAHVHEYDNAPPAARLVSPRELVGSQVYVAALVPAYRLNGLGDTATVVDAWGGDPVTLPCYDTWRFTTTSAEGDFAQLAQRLKPVDPTTLPEFGIGHVRLRDGDPAPGEAIRGALALIQPPAPDAAPLDPAVTTWMGDLTGPVVGPAGRWVLTLPDYTAPWSGTAAPGGWRDQLATDPRRRMAAGLGSWAAIEWQRRLCDAAAAQSGALDLASAMIRHLTAGLAAGRGLWRRRFPVDPVERLVLLAPMLTRLPSTSGGSVLDHVAGRTPTFVPELFSSAARRVLRPGPARSTQAAPGAADLAAVLRYAAKCPPPPPRDDLDDLLAAPFNPDAATQALHEHGLSGDLGPLSGMLGGRPDRQRQPCFAVDLDGLGRTVAAAVDPTVARPIVVERVLGRISGLPEPRLAPPDFAPELDLPLWPFLAERARDWLLPGIGALAKDRVVAVASNSVFIDAFLLGANVQTLGELRWRNIPVRSGWTPLRRFWTHIDNSGAPVTDIRPVLGNVPPSWSDASPLGADGHGPVDPPTPGGRDRLVILFHTELFRRYPTTVVYLVEADRVGGEVTWVGVPDADSLVAKRTDPVLTGHVGPDVTFFGFPVPPAAAADHWVVLEEPPPGTRLRTQPVKPADPKPWLSAVNAAEYAEKAFAQPVRVFLGHLLG